MIKNILKSIFIVLFTSTFCFAQLQKDNVFVIGDFSKMLQSAVNPYLLPNNAAQEARNVRSNDVVGSLSKREDMKTYGSAGEITIKGMHRFYKSDGTKYVIVGGGTFLKYGDDDTGTFTTLRDELTDGQRWDMMTYTDTAIMMNGSNAPQKWDGHIVTTDNTDGARTVNILTAELGAPYAELNTGSNLDADSWYQYRVVYYDGTTYFYSTARSNPILTGSSVQDITLTDVPLGPSGTTQRLIYRTEGNASRAAVEADTSFYRVTTISDNTTTTYNDTMDDATLLGDSAPTWATVSAGTDITPPIGKYGLIHKERLFIANRPNLKSDLYWSEPFLINYFDIAGEFEQIRPDDGDEITFIKPLLGILIIGKTNSIQKFLTNSTNTANWILTDPFSFVGCPAPFSAQTSPLGIIYLSRSGIYVFNGERSQLISDSITPEIKDIVTTSFSEVNSLYFENVYQMAYTSQLSGSASNDSVLLFDITRDAYVIDDKKVGAFEVFDSGTDFGTIYSASSTTNGNVQAHSTNPSELIQRYKSDLELGTVDDVIIYNTEDEPKIELGWDATIDSTELSGLTINGYTPATAIIDRPDTDGTWTSPAFEISAKTFDKLYWNETLGSGGDITFAIRAASTAAGLSSESWSSEVSDPSGSDISGVTANTFVQLRASLSTTDITLTPILEQKNNFVIRMAYSKIGSSAETSILSLYRSGWLNLGVDFYPKRIKEIRVYYTGSSGTIKFALENSEGDISTSFSIDLSQVPESMNWQSPYKGTTSRKIYQWEPPLVGDDAPIGTYWEFLITESGVIDWTIDRIEIFYDIEEDN